MYLFLHSTQSVDVEGPVGFFFQRIKNSRLFLKRSPKRAKKLLKSANGCVIQSFKTHKKSRYKQLLYYPQILIFLGWLKLACFQMRSIKSDHCAVHEGCALGLTFITKGTMRIINVRIYTYTQYIHTICIRSHPSSALVPLIALYHIVRIQKKNISNTKLGNWNLEKQIPLPICFQ